MSRRAASKSGLQKQGTQGQRDVSTGGALDKSLIQTRQPSRSHGNKSHTRQQELNGASAAGAPGANDRSMRMVNNQKTNFIKKRPLDQSRSKTRNTKDKNTSFTGSIATN